MPSLNRLRVVVLLNASAGTIERQGNKRLCGDLMFAFDKHGISAVMEFLPGAELRSAAERTRQRVAGGFQHLIPLATLFGYLIQKTPIVLGCNATKHGAQGWP